MEEGNEIEIVCPTCSPKEETWHEVLKGGQSPVAKCMDCGNVHSYRIPRVKTKVVKIIVSQMDNSHVMHMLLDEKERFFMDDELIVEDMTTGDVVAILITVLECGDKRKPSAAVKDIDTIWGRAIDEVTVKIAVQHKDITKPMEQRVSGDFKFIVGKTLKIDGKEFPIVSIKVRGGGFKSKEGDSVMAKRIKRIYAKKPSFSSRKY